MHEHAKRAEARAKTAYEQNRAALDLITKSMDNVKDAFTEANQRLTVRDEGYHRSGRVLHDGKCTECVRFGLHILMPGNRAKFLYATSAQ